jgi:uncharacterized repeat protein (TIGR01451 family)
MKSMKYLIHIFVCFSVLLQSFSSIIVVMASSYTNTVGLQKDKISFEGTKTFNTQGKNRLKNSPFKKYNEEAERGVFEATNSHQAVDLIFAMDTSGSMNDEFSALCSKIDDVVNDLLGQGITVQPKILGIDGNLECTEDTITNLIPNAKSDHIEDWGPAIYDLAYGYPWTPGYARMVIPMSDEAPENGDGCFDPGDDRQSIVDAVQAAKNNGVRVSPVLGSGYSYCVQSLAEDLANGTGGQVFLSTVPSNDLANGIADLVRWAINPDPSGEAEPSELPDFWLRPTNNMFGGAQDERFLWEHNDIEDIFAFRQAYHNSVGSTDSIVIPISRYYGVTNADQTLQDHVIDHAIKAANLIICAWDIDFGEKVSIQINNGYSFDLNGFDGGWSCRAHPLNASALKSLFFPSSPGQASNPEDPNSKPKSLTPATNSLMITYPLNSKALVYGMRLQIEAVYPVVLVPGFGGNASDYSWGEVKNQLNNEYGVITEQPCDYEWYFDVLSLPPQWKAQPHHKRCFERVSRFKRDTGTLETNSTALRWTIDEVKTRYGVDTVNLVGHSKGGLFSRAYVSDDYYRGDVENLVSISSPQRGGYLQDIAVKTKDLPYCEPGIENVFCESKRSLLEQAINLVTNLGVNFKPNNGDQAGLEVTEAYFEGALKDFLSPNGVTYHSIVATAAIPAEVSSMDPDRDIMGPCAEWTNGCVGLLPLAYDINYDSEATPNRGQSDILVLAPSQRIANIKEEYETAEASCSVIRANHQESSQILAAGYAVAQALGVKEASQVGVLSCTGVTELPSSTTRQAQLSINQATAQITETVSILEFSDVITYGETASIEFQVDGEHLDIAGGWNGDGMVALTLTDANGQAITPTATYSDTNFDYDEIRDPSQDSGLAMYHITDTVKGLWAAHIIAPDTGAASEDIWWNLFISQQSPLSMTLNATSPKYAQGVSVTLQARAVTATLPLIGAYMQANIRGRNGATLTLALRDDGLHSDVAANDGIYGVQFTPPAPDAYWIEATMTGTIPSGIAYMRQDTAYFDVLPSTAHFTDIYTDTSIDVDGDGFFDNLRVGVGVTLTTGGEFTLIGTLSDTTGSALESLPVAISATAGTTVTALLDFDATSLVDNEIVGPLILGNLILLDKYVNLPTDRRGKVYTTSTYSYLDFSGWEVRTTSPLTDTGVDTNSNGKFDYLEVQVPVEVRHAGMYTATAWLETVPGKAIIAPQSTVSVTSPSTPATVTFAFNGPMIALNSVDGPYTITNMLVEGPFGFAKMESLLGTTSVYSYTDFESDVITPTSSIEPLPTVITRTPIINVAWSGVDTAPGVGIASYDVQYKVNDTGTWVNWLTQTMLTSYAFGPFDPITLTSGTTYYFRVRANDYAGNQEPYIGEEGDAYTLMTGVDPQVTNMAVGEFIAGHQGHYTFNYKNRGPLPAEDVILTDTLPVGFTYVSDSSSITPTVSGNQVVWRLGNVLAYDHQQFEIVVDISQDLIGGQTVTNTLEIHTSSMEHKTINNIAHAPTTIITPTWDMQVSKSLYRGQPFAGEEIRYRIWYANAGNSDALDIVITDTLPVSATYVSDYNAEGFRTVITGNTVVWTHTIVPSGDSGYLYLSVNIDQQASDNMTLTNKVEIANHYLETNYDNNTYTQTTAVLPRTRDMYISKSLYDGIAVADGEVKYRIHFANQGNSMAEDVVITDTLPLSSTYVSDSNSYGFTTSITGSKVVWEKDSVESGHSGYIYLTVHFNDDIPGNTPLTNTVAVANKYEETEYTDNVYTYTLSAEIPTRDMRISKALASGSPTPGNLMHYKLSYCNQGNSLAHTVIVTDTLPTPLAYLYTLEGSVPPTSVGDKLVWHLGDIPANFYPDACGTLEVMTYVPITIPIGTVLTNTATISTMDEETDYTDNTAYRVDTMRVGTSDLAISKRMLNQQAAIGEDIVYLLSYNNYRSDAATQVVITDVLPSEMTFVSSKGVVTPAIQGQTLVWYLPSITGRYLPGSSGEITVTAHLSEDVKAGDKLTNTLMITATNDINPTNNVRQYVTTAYSPTCDVTIDKGVAGGTPAIGRHITFTLTYHNRGNASAENVVITDTLPEEMTYISSSIEPTVQGQTLTWALESIPGQYLDGYYGQIQLVVQISEAVMIGERLCNDVEIATSSTETGSYSNYDSYCVTAQEPRPDLSLDKNLYRGTPQPDNTLTYRLYYRNYGAVRANNIVVTDTLPVGMYYDEAYAGNDTSGWTRQISGTMVVWTRPYLDPEQNGYLYVSGYISTTVMPKTVLTNTATITSATGESYLENNTATHEAYILSPEVDLLITKKSSGGQTVSGETFTYRIDYKNAGLQTAYNVIITDTLPDEVEFEYVNYTGYNWNMHNEQQVITWTLNSLSSGYAGSIDLTVRVTTTLSDVTAITNTVEISSNTLDYDSTDNVATYTVSLLPSFENQAPYAPSNPEPPNTATMIPLDQTLRWQGGDPNNDTVTYTVAFGATNPPPIVAETTTKTYIPGMLALDTTYYWRITATDGLSKVVGSLWSFTTIEEEINQAPNTPSNPIPASGAANVATDQVLHWDGGDPDNDKITYTLALGTSSPPITVITDVVFTNYAPGALLTDTTYYWVITATDSISTVMGPIWAFTTTTRRPSNHAPYPPMNPIPFDKEARVPVDQTLSWQSGDPDGDIVTYTLAISFTKEMVNSPLTVTTDLNKTKFEPGILSPTTTYNWVVTATDGLSVSVGPTWEFTTQDRKSLVYLPLVLRNR